MKNEASVRALERGLEILSCFDEQNRFLSLTDISKKTELSVTTVSRLLGTLVKHNFLQRDQQRKYCLGSNIFKLVEMVNYKPDLRTVALPFLQTLRDMFNETASLYVAQNDVRVCLESVESKQPLRRTVQVGEVLPLARGAVGIVLLAWLPFTERQKILKQNTHINEKDLFAIRQAGFAINDSLQEAGVFSIAGPIFNEHGQNIASISISGPSSRITEDIRTELIDAIKLNGNLISQALGYKNK